MNDDWDFDCIDDLSPDLKLVTGRSRRLQQRLARRFSMQRLALWYAPNTGLDLRTLVLSNPMYHQMVSSLIEGEAIKDPEVSSATCTIFKDPNTDEWAIEIQVTTTFGEDVPSVRVM